MNRSDDRCVCGCARDQHRTPILTREARQAICDVAERSFAHRNLTTLRSLNAFLHHGAELNNNEARAILQEQPETAPLLVGDGACTACGCRLFRLRKLRFIPRGAR